MRLSICDADIDPLKTQLLELAPAIKASHRVEAMARGFGFGSHAALLAGVAEGAVTCSIDNRAFAEFLRERGGDNVPYDTLFEAVVRTKMPEQRAAIEAILSREPALSANGFRSFDPRGPLQENRADFEASRQSMLDAHQVAQFVRATEFLETLEKSKNLSRDRTSYGYKHDAERFHRETAPGEDPYVANGVFIAAALHLGFVVKRDGKSPNAFINIAKPKATRRRTDLAGTLRGSRKVAAWRNMMVGAINAGLDQGIFGLGEDDNRWDGEDGIFRFGFDGLPAIACVRDIGHGELAVHVALNPSARAEDFIRTYNAGFVAGDAFGSGWFERKLGCWLQTSGSPTGSIRAAMLERIVAARPTPHGYADHGRTMM